MIKRVEVTGEITIAWSKEIVMPQNLNDVEDATILVLAETAETTKRMLQAWKQAVPDRIVTVN